MAERSGEYEGQTAPQWCGDDGKWQPLKVPQAVIALKQGTGRLIRDEADFGVVMICDTRLVTKSYGRLFIDSLPPVARTRELAGGIAALSPLAVQGAKHVMNAAFAADEQRSLDYVALWNAAFLHSQDLEEAATAFVERRAPRFKGR